MGRFWRIFGQIAILELWVEKLAKILENVEKDREFDVFTKNSRQFGDFFRISNLDRQNWPKIRQFDVVFRVNSSVSFNHEEFSISFQFDEFFRIFGEFFVPFRRETAGFVVLHAYFDIVSQ